MLWVRPSVATTASFRTAIEPSQLARTTIVRTSDLGKVTVRNHRTAPQMTLGHMTASGHRFLRTACLLASTVLAAARSNEHAPVSRVLGAIGVLVCLLTASRSFQASVVPWVR